MEEISRWPMAGTINKYRFRPAKVVLAFLAGDARCSGEKQKCEPEGYYDGYGYKVVKSGKVDVDFGDRIVRFGSLEEMVAN